MGTDALSQVTTTTSSRAASRGRPCLQANDWKSDDETTASTLVYGPTAVSRLRQVGAAGDPVDVLHDQHCGEPRPLQASDEESLGKGGKDSPRALLSEQGEPGVTGGSPAESARSSDARTSETDLDSSPQCPEAAQLATELEWMDAAYREMEKCMDCFNVLGLRFANSPLPAMSPNGSGAGGSDDDCTMTRGPSAGARKKFHPGPYKPFLKKDRLAAKKKQTAVKASYTKLHKVREMVPYVRTARLHVKHATKNREVSVGYCDMPLPTCHALFGSTAGRENMFPGVQFTTAFCRHRRFTAAART